MKNIIDPNHRNTDIHWDSEKNVFSQDIFLQGSRLTSGLTDRESGRYLWSSWINSCGCKCHYSALNWHLTCTSINMILPQALVNWSALKNNTNLWKKEQSKLVLRVFVFAKWETNRMERWQSGAPSGPFLTHPRTYASSGLYKHHGKHLLHLREEDAGTGPSGGHWVTQSPRGSHPH